MSSAAKSGAVLTLNAGSSSVKFALFEAGTSRRLAQDEIEDPGDVQDGLVDKLLVWADDHLDGDELAAVGHRIVHGGMDFAAPVRIDDVVLGDLDKLIPLAPLHLPHNLAPIRAIAARRPNLAQIACFDTGFHRSMPELAVRLPLPARLHDAGIRRYGFHGLSYEYIANRFATLDPARAAGRVIAAHLGSGASACALMAGKSVATTMGFTALDGMMMATRPGALDPGVVLYLAEHDHLEPGAISDLLYHHSGLLGVSGEASDMRKLLASDRDEARFAVDLFCYRAACEIAGLTVALGGLDALIFTAGIGEHTAPVRRDICRRLGHFGIELDDAANDRGEAIISAAASAVAVRVIPTDEEATIARHTIALLADHGC